MIILKGEKKRANDKARLWCCYPVLSVTDLKIGVVPYDSIPHIRL